ncbi:MAG: RNB domain-containing ribonuclease, partial [Bacilli bacterium]|nr:RNB domain-containing ribonuclease [Bacilli bacterium]
VELRENFVNPKVIEYEFIDYLIKEPREIDYIEYIFDKMPEIMKSKDQDGVSLYQNIIKKYVQSIKEEEEEKLLYYKRLIQIMLSNNQYKINNHEKKLALQYIQTEVGKIGSQKKYKKTIEKLKELREFITSYNQTQITLDSIASKYGIQLDFPSSVQEEVNKLKPIHSKDYPDRKIIEDYVLTIDGENASEIDDALSCKKLENGNYLLGVHIASILGYFPYDSEVVQNALERGHSIYFRKFIKDNNLSPIFPLEFSAGFGSLEEGKEKLTRSYLFEIDPKGDIVHEEFIKSIIKSNKKATYDEINDILEEDNTEATELTQTVTLLHEVAGLLKQRYQANELYELMKENKKDSSDLVLKRVASEEIVYECMQLTGNRVADYFASHGYPCLYRVHNIDEKLNNKIKSMIDNLVKVYGKEETKKLYSLMDGIYPKSEYDSSGSHMGLGLDHYCHCTSGLRRSADIVVEHALEDCYDKDPTPEELIKLEKEIEMKKNLINQKDDSIDWFVEEVHKSYKKIKK